VGGNSAGRLALVALPSPAHGYEGSPHQLRHPIPHPQHYSHHQPGGGAHDSICVGPGGLAPSATYGPAGPRSEPQVQPQQAAPGHPYPHHHHSAEPAPAPAMLPAPAPAPAPAALPVLPPGRRFITRAVVIDDVRSNRDLFAVLLARRLGVGEVLRCDGGHEAVALARGMASAAERESFVWFTDKKMPGADGHYVARSLRAMGVTAPIFGVTGDALEEDQRAFRAAGVDAVLPKPVTVEALVALLAGFGIECPKLWAARQAGAGAGE
jgi:CheY-like chemotaxis protein